MNAPATRKPVVEARGICVRAGRTQILSGIDMAVRPGEIVTLVGPNGSGKTTLLRVLVGAMRADAGRVLRSPGLTIGYVPQRLSVDRTMPLTLGRFLRLAGGTAEERRAALATAGLAGAEDRQVAALSGGQMQRALLARALLRRPGLLALDEPTAGLDQPGIAEFYALIADLRDRLGCAILLVSHDLHVVMSASDRVICLNGHICCEGAPTQVGSAPAYRALFGEGTRGALALYRHEHDHRHDGDCGHDRDRDPGRVSGAGG